MDHAPTHGLKPFWRYYGGKWRAAPKYPKPRHRVIIEPFAGAAGYSCRYSDHDVCLIDRSPIIAGIWRYLISVPAAEVRAIPEVEHVDALPSWVPQEARWLVGFWMNAAPVTPRLSRSAGLARLIEGNYDALDGEATWFVDPPYNNKAGAYYPEQPADFEALGAWCRSRTGQVIVCENEGATWLPFQPFATFKASIKPGSREVVWLS